MVQKQFLIYILVGVVTVLADISVMQGLIFLGMPLGGATTIGFLIGFLTNYFLHARYTFKAASSARMLTRFSIVVFSNYLITMLCTFAAQSALDNPLLGKLASIPLATCNGFYLSKKWVYR